MVRTLKIGLSLAGKLLQMKVKSKNTLKRVSKVLQNDKKKLNYVNAINTNKQDVKSIVGIISLNQQLVATKQTK